MERSTKAAAQGNLTPVGHLPEILRLLGAIIGVIDMSDPEHESFADSGADCLDALLQHEEPLRALLADLGRPAPQA